MSIANRIATSLLMTCCLIVASTAASAGDPPVPQTAAQPANPQKPSFDLSEAQIRRFLSAQREILESPEAVRIANDWRGGRESIAIQKPAKADLRARPAMIECGGLGAKCAAYDAAGNYLFAVSNRRINLGVNDPGTLNCGRSSNLMSTFERADRCRGIGVVIPSIWETPSRRYAP